MLKLRTKTAFEIRDKRNKVLGDFIVYLIIDGLTLSKNNVNAVGYYYYIDANNAVQQLDPFNETYGWDEIGFAETSYFGAINTSSFEVFAKQRILEFAQLQLQIEGGENFNTTPSDWEFFE